MGALLVLKVLIPMVLVTCAFFVLLTLRQESPQRLCLAVILFSNVLAIRFFFLVRDEGSWKEIGNSISMFIIVNAKIAFCPLLLLIARALLHPRRSGQSFKHDKLAVE
jgi:phosphatidylinositol glycan class N